MALTNSVPKGKEPGWRIAPGVIFRSTFPDIKFGWGVIPLIEPMLGQVHAAQLCRTPTPANPPRPTILRLRSIATFPGDTPLWWVDVNQK